MIKTGEYYFERRLETLGPLSGDRAWKSFSKKGLETLGPLSGEVCGREFRRDWSKLTTSGDGKTSKRVLERYTSKRQPCSGRAGRAWSWQSLAPCTLRVAMRIQLRSAQGRIGIYRYTFDDFCVSSIHHLYIYIYIYLYTYIYIYIYKFFQKSGSIYHGQGVELWSKLVNIVSKSV